MKFVNAMLTDNSNRSGVRGLSFVNRVRNHAGNFASLFLKRSRQIFTIQILFAVVWTAFFSGVTVIAEDQAKLSKLPSSYDWKWIAILSVATILVVVLVWLTKKVKKIDTDLTEKVKKIDTNLTEKVKNTNANLNKDINANLTEEVNKIRNYLINFEHKLISFEAEFKKKVSDLEERQDKIARSADDKQLPNNLQGVDQADVASLTEVGNLTSSTTPPSNVTQEKIGVQYVKFCHESKAEFSDADLLDMIKRAVPEASVKSIYRPTAAQEIYFIDDGRGALKYWLVSVGSEDFLLPTPKSSEAFQSLKGFDCQGATPQNIKVCLPAKLIRNEFRWELGPGGPGRLSNDDPNETLPAHSEPTPNPIVNEGTGSAGNSTEVWKSLLMTKVGSAFTKLCKNVFQKTDEFSTEYQIFSEFKHLLGNSDPIPEFLNLQKVSGDRKLLRKVGQPPLEGFWLLRFTRTNEDLCMVIPQVTNLGLKGVKEDSVFKLTFPPSLFLYQLSSQSSLGRISSMIPCSVKPDVNVPDMFEIIEQGQIVVK